MYTNKSVSNNDQDNECGEYGSRTDEEAGKQSFTCREVETVRILVILVRNLE